ncbi:MAG: hypothetical protein HQL73_00460 [Magnetococcales bacterium]|nr:hypothetical protein [Magnetococcales bacterium]
MTTDTLFKLYGAWVDHLFLTRPEDDPNPFASRNTTADAAAAIPTPGDRPSLADPSGMPKWYPSPSHPSATSPGSPDGHGPGEGFGNNLQKILSEEDKNKIIRSVEHYRNNLREEQSQPSAGQPVSLALKQFREHLSSGREDSLVENPFHQIVLMLFHATRLGLFRFLHNQIMERLPPLPEMIRSAPTMRELWRRPKALGGRLSNVTDMVRAYGVLLRGPMAILLFLVSAGAIFFDLNDFLQDATVAHNPLAFQGDRGAWLRQITALFVGVMIATVVLDGKNRLLQRVAEAGGVLAGIRQAFLIHPRWMTLVGLCALVAIKAGNDIIIAILSEREMVTQYVDRVERIVDASLGQATATGPPRPDSLYGLRDTLKEDVEALVRSWERLPVVEAEPITTSDPSLRKSPRFWAAHFIIHGGYEPGISDVEISNPSSLSKHLDALLASSGIDFFSSFRDKSGLLVDACNQRLNKIQARVREQLAALHALADREGGIRATIKLVLFMNLFQINARVADIGQDLENVRASCRQAREDVAELIHGYRPILRFVLPSATLNLDDDAIASDVTAWSGRGVAAMTPDQLPGIPYRTSLAFAGIPGLGHGFWSDPALLTLITVLASGIMLGDLLLFAPVIGRCGRSDRTLVAMRLEELKTWESSFIAVTTEWLDASQARCLLGGDLRFTRIAAELRFYKQIEKIDPETKHPQDRHPLEAGVNWLYRVFTCHRTSWARCYNVRLAALQRLLHPKNNHFHDWLHGFYFGPISPRRFQRSTLAEISRFMQENGERTKMEVDQTIFWQLGRSKKTSKQPPEKGIWNIVLALTPLSRGIRRLTSHLSRLGAMLVTRGFQSPPDWFPLTFYHWRMKFCSRLDQYSNLRDQLYRLQPEIHVIYEKSVAIIYNEIFYPIAEIRKKYGQHLSYHWEIQYSEFEFNLYAFEKKILETMGVLPLMVAATSLRELVEALDYIETVMDLNLEIVADVLNFIDSGLLFSGTNNENTGKKLKDCGQRLLREAHTQLALVREDEKKKWKDVEGIADLLDARLLEVRKIFNNISSLFIRIRQKETDFKTKGYPSPVIRVNHQLNQTLINQAPKEADQILGRIETILAAPHPYTPENLTMVEILKKDTEALYDRLNSYVSSIMELPLPTVAGKNS